MESIQSKLVKAMLRVIKLNKMWKETGVKLRKSLEIKQLCENHEPPKNIKIRFSVSKNFINGYYYYVIKPFKDVTNKHIFFLHGGGYVYEITILHWEFLGRLIDALHCTITVPIYPLAPKHQCEEVFDMLLPAYEQIILEVKSEDVVIMGDSAGGAMGLALAQLLKEKNMMQPKDIILISPALDMSFSNPEINAVEKNDPVLAVPSLKDICKWYGGSYGVKHHLISPMYGNLHGLGTISLFTGTDDICNPDARKFKIMTDELGIKINYYEYPHMIHIWPLFLFDEAKRATEQIVEIITRSNSQITLSME